MFPAIFVNDIDLRYHIARRSGRVTFKIGMGTYLDNREFYVKGAPRYFTIFERSIMFNHVSTPVWQPNFKEEYRPRMFMWQKYRRGHRKVSLIKLKKRSHHVPSL